MKGLLGLSNPKILITTIGLKANLSRENFILFGISDPSQASIYFLIIMSNGCSSLLLLIRSWNQYNYKNTQ